MTGPIATLLLLLFPCPPGGTGSMSVPPDTPASDVVRIKSPYALAKDRSRGPNPPTELVSPYPALVMCTPPRGWVQLNGQLMRTEWDDVDRVTMSGDWLVSQDRQGRYHMFDLTGPSTCPHSMSSLADANDQLARRGCAPVFDVDFRTFEELADERGRRRVKWSLVGLAVGILPLAGVVLAAMVRRPV